MEDVEEQIRDELTGDCLLIRKGNRFLFDNIDSFVTLSQEIDIITRVILYLFDNDPGNYEFWDKVGQIVGNLMELKTLEIFLQPIEDDDEDRARMPDWETLSRILPYLRRKVALSLITHLSETEGEEMIGLARAIHGHPMISEFISRMDFTFANFIPLCSALATLPYLERVSFGLREPETEDQLELVNLEPFRELLRTPALRFVRFDNFYFTNALCHATANALEEGSSVIGINFENDCEFPDGGRAIIANALKRNTTVTSIKFFGHCDEPFCNNFAVALLCNSTLQILTVHTKTPDRGRWLSPIFLSLGMNTALKSLTVKICDEFGDELCAAIRSGLAKNSTLEELSLYDIIPSNDGGTLSARNVLSFLRTNCTLKSLTVTFERVREESYVSAFRLEAVKMRQDNSSLESLTIATDEIIEATHHNLLHESRKIKFEELLALVSALQRDTTLKTLGFQSHLVLSFRMITLTDDEMNQLVPIVMKNYGLQRLVPDLSSADDGTFKAILRLNGAGRRYLIEDGSSISKGVDVLSAVRDDINCVFLHLLENPGLCNRRAFDGTTRSLRPGANHDQSSSSGKRERAAQSQPAEKEPHCLVA